MVGAIYPSWVKTPEKDTSKRSGGSFSNEFKSPPAVPRDALNGNKRKEADKGCLPSLKPVYIIFLTLSLSLSLNGAPAVSNSDFQRTLCITSYECMKSSITAVVSHLMDPCKPHSEKFAVCPTW